MALRTNVCGVLGLAGCHMDLIVHEKRYMYMYQLLRAAGCHMDLIVHEKRYMYMYQLLRAVYTATYPRLCICRKHAVVIQIQCERGRYDK